MSTRRLVRDYELLPETSETFTLPRSDHDQALGIEFDLKTFQTSSARLYPLGSIAK